MNPRRMHGTLVAIAVAAALLGCKDPGERLEEHRERASAYLEAGEFAEAIVEYRNMLQIDPNDASAHWGLAKAFLGSQEPRKAYWELQETIRLDPANLDAKLQYAQFLLFGKQEELTRAVELADEVLASDPQSSPAYLLKARALLGLKRTDEAGEVLRSAVEIAPEDPAPLLLLATFTRQYGSAEEAERLFRALTEVDSGFASHAALGGFLASLGGRDAEAEAEYRKAVETAKPERQVTAYQLLANFFYARGRLPEAEAVMREGIERVENNLQLIYGLARLYHGRGDTERAEEMIQEASSTRPGDPEPLLLLSTYRGRIGDQEGALQAAERAIEVAPDDVRARLRKAELLVDIGYRAGDATLVAQGRSVVDAILAETASSAEGLFVKAKIDLAEGKREEAVAALRRSLDTRPDWPQAHFLLASALFLQGDRAEARAEVSRALELEADFTAAQKLLARVHAALGDHDLAVEVGLRALEREPDDAATRLLVAQSLVHQRKVTEALAELDRIPAEKRGAEEHYARGRVHVLMGEREGARREFLAAAQAEPGRYEILRALLDLDVREGRLSESSERILAAFRGQPDDARLNQLMGEVALYTGRSAEAESHFRRAIDLDPNDLRAYQSLARYLAVTGRPTEVLETYQQALTRNENSPILHLIVGSLHELQGQADEAIERYEDAIRLDPSLAVAKNNLAYLLAERGANLDRALDLAQEAKALLPNNPNTADTLGWVLYKKRVPSAAIGYLREAEGGMPPDDPQIGLVRHHLALAYEANGQPERAREVLDRAIRDLERQFGRGEAERSPEPPWAAELRSMHARLSGAS